MKFASPPSQIKYEGREYTRLPRGKYVSGSASAGNYAELDPAIVSLVLAGKAPVGCETVGGILEYGSSFSSGGGEFAGGSASVGLDTSAGSGVGSC